MESFESTLRKYKQDPNIKNLKHLFFNSERFNKCIFFYDIQKSIYTDRSVINLNILTKNDNLHTTRRKSKYDIYIHGYRVFTLVRSTAVSKEKFYLQIYDYDTHRDEQKVKQISAEESYCPGFGYEVFMPPYLITSPLFEENTISLLPLAREMTKNLWYFERYDCAEFVEVPRPRL